MGDDLQASEATDRPALLRIATIGTSPDAVFHLESAAIRDELTPVVAARCDGNESSPQPVPGCSVCEIDELTERSDVDVVFVCGRVETRIDFAIQLLQSGKHVVIEPSSSLSTDQIQPLINFVETGDKHCEIWRPYNADPDFRRAARLVASGEAGPVRSLRFMQHDLAAALLPRDESVVSRDRLTASTLRDLVAHRIAQAITLADAPVRTSTGQFRKDELVLGERGSVRNVSPEGDTSFHSVIEFENGATAIIDISLASPAPYSTGWIVQGNQGGYHTERQYITVDDGEIYDVAVEVEPFDPYLNLHSDLRHWPTPELQNRRLDQLRAELELAKHLESILQVEF